jgi:hypothetical protein
MNLRALLELIKDSNKGLKEREKTYNKNIKLKGKNV